MGFPYALTTSELNSHMENSAAQHLGIAIVDIGPDWIDASMPIDQRTQGIDGKLKMGAIAVLTESAGSLASSLCVNREQFIVLGQTLEVTHLTDAATGPVVAHATALSLEEDKHIWNIGVCDHEGTAIALAKLCVVVLPKALASRNSI